MSNNLLNSMQTGMLQYSKKKNFLGPGFTFSEFETFLIDCFVTDFNNYSPTLLQNEIQNTFSNLYSGNVYVRTFQIPGGYNDPKNDGIRTARFQVQIENRLPIVNLSAIQPELTGNNYAGINSNFWSSYGPNFNSFTENYDYSKKDDGMLSTEHSISFSVLTGSYSLATGIASYIYNADISGASSNAFYTNLSSTIITPNSLIDTNKTRQYYTESYDLIKNNYAFTKHTDYPPLLSENNYNVNKNVKNTIILSEDGITTVSEEGKIKAYLDFNQAILEFSTTQSNNDIFNRCNNFYNNFSSLANITNGVLNNWTIKNEVVYNKPGLMLDYNISYTDNPNFSGVFDSIVQKTIKIDLIEDKYINIEHSYDFTRLAHITLAQTGIMMSAILAADLESGPLITGIYQNSEVYNPYLPIIPRIKESFSLPNRKRTFNANFIYSNQPIFFLNINGTIYPKLEWKITDNTPDNMVQEYKVINRPSQTSVLSYAYQTTKGSKIININGYLTRNYGQTFTSPQSIKAQFIPLFNWGVQQLMNTFNNQNILAFNYYLNDVKLSFTSENEYQMSIEIVYTQKLYS